MLLLPLGFSPPSCEEEGCDLGYRGKLFSGLFSGRAHLFICITLYTICKFHYPSWRSEYCPLFSRRSSIHEKYPIGQLVVQLLISWDSSHLSRTLAKTIGYLSTNYRPLLCKKFLQMVHLPVNIHPCIKFIQGSPTCQHTTLPQTNSKAPPLPIVQTLLTPTAFCIVIFFTNVLLTCCYPDIVHHHHFMFCLFLSVLT